jgi:ADP-ribosylglycohydrolase
MNNTTNKIIDALLGLAIGDSLGVPVEFKSRETLDQNPVKGMLEFGTHHQLAGTWSDDSAMAFCLAESLCDGYNLNQIGQYFVLWYDSGFWSARGEVFDVGISTAQALNQFKRLKDPLISGNFGEDSNGNGSLMRILPLLFYLRDKEISERFETISAVSAITHGHIRSIIACFIYIEFALELLNGAEKVQAYKNMQITINSFLKQFKICDEVELNRFHRILENAYGDYEIRPILDYKEAEISSRGYVIDTLEASIWCFLKFDNFSDSVLKAVNLGGDTDTTGCVTGGLAGLYYGSSSIPTAWLNVLAKKDNIIDLGKRLNDKYPKSA